MSNIFVRPSHLHKPDRILSCSSETGLSLAQPLPDAANLGKMRLRVAGTPTAVTALDVQAFTGGNPVGYNPYTGGTGGGGASLIWKNQTDSGAANTMHWRGYNDTPYLTRVHYPVPYGTGLGAPSKPRELPDGYMGFMVSNCPGTASKVQFVRVSPTDYSSTVIDITSTTASNDAQGDICVLPDGRIVAITTTGSSLVRYESRDYGLTWTAGVSCGSSGTAEEVQLEVMGGTLYMLLSDATATTGTRTSQDDGYSWSNLTYTTGPLRATCVTATGRVLAATVTTVHDFTPGGVSTASSTVTANTYAKLRLATRDDGVIWAVLANDIATRPSLMLAHSTDGGITWTEETSASMDANSLLTNSGIKRLSAGFWGGRLIILVLSQSAGAASDYAIQMYELGGWDTLTEMGTYSSTVSPYTATYIPFDYPENFTSPWNKVNIAAGGTITNQGPLKIVATAANNSYWIPPTSFHPASDAGGSRKIRFRCRIPSGGDRTIASQALLFMLSDGAGNQQGFHLTMDSTGFRLSANTTTAGGIAAKALDLTKVTDFFFAFKHDAIVGVSAQLTALYRQDGDTTWTKIISGASIAEVVLAGNSRLWLGGAAAAVGQMEIYYLGISNSSATMEDAFNNPDDLRGRPLPAFTSMHLANGIKVSGRNTSALAGDLYEVESTYSYAKEDIWTELRPSRQVRSTADNNSWNVTFDATATDTFRGDTVALFGTNFRTAKFQLHTANAWGAPAVTIDLDATIWSGAIDVTSRGPGYVGVLATPKWRPGQFRSATGHRFFMELFSGAVHEITDNDASRLFVEGVDFSAEVGSVKIFADKMAVTGTSYTYRYMRLLVGAQNTADNHYRLGTVLFDQKFTFSKQYDENFTDRVEPNVVSFTSEAGYQSKALQGPRRSSTQLMWGPIDAMHPTQGDLANQIRDFYSAIEGNLTPIVWWRDTTDQSTLSLVYVEGIFASPNLLGELKTALARVDQLDFVEVL